MIRRFVIWLVRRYQGVSRCFPARCRFYPTCSDYTIEAVQKHGIVAGLWLSLRRICRCHRWNPGGVDPVPEARRRKPDVGLNDVNEQSDLTSPKGD
ncbi:MAG: membrane protein insertion efficiency factor YidD [Kiritimatiellales bacterium]|nr:membrane protein insertion efficiency factor YidD [Kiritimatiellota bacterium]MBL7017091.1 membrane protein insertion efficiency factor YidD [Kiritimatiellales bacterium]